MKMRPMILRFSSGSSTPASASRKRVARVDGTQAIAEALAERGRRPARPRPARSRPLSTKTHVRRSPIGAVDDQRRGDRGVDAAGERADDAARRRPARGCARPRGSTKFSIVQSARRWQTRKRKFRRISVPLSGVRDLGVELDAVDAAARGRRTAAIRRVVARRRATSKPGGERSMRSPWLIHTAASSAPPKPAKRSTSSMRSRSARRRTRVRSRAPTLPPSDGLSTCMP